MDFKPYPKIRRSKDNGIVITQKIDGTNAQIAINESGEMWVGSRKRWITPGKETDNFGFAAWCDQNRDALLTLGPGRHYGEWYGPGIQRGYGLAERRLALFNIHRPADTLPGCVGQVPILYRGAYSSQAIDQTFATLYEQGSVAVPGFRQPEGIVIYHFLTRALIKRTFDGDVPKGSI